MLKDSIQRVLLLSVSIISILLSSCTDSGTNSDGNDGSDTQKNKVTVSFESNGGSSVESQSIPIGDTITEPEEPTKAGENFSGWYSDSALLRTWNFADTVSTDMRLYAKWADTSTAMILEYEKAENNPLTVTLALKGEVDLTIDWGDGVFEAIVGSAIVSHDYAPSDSIVRVSLKGKVTHFGDSGVYQDRLREVVSFGDMGLTSLSYGFKRKKKNYSAPKLKLPNNIPSTVKDLSYLFYNMVYLPKEISGWNVSHIEDMKFLFRSVENMSSADISGWDVSNVTNMSYMFSNTRVSPDISQWNVSSVTTMEGMFSSSEVSTELSSWNVSSVTDMSYMFYLSDLDKDISQWNVSSVTTMEGIFSGVDTLHFSLNDWDVSSVTNMKQMFLGMAVYNGSISDWDVSSVTTMEEMFLYFRSFNGDLSRWNVSSVTSMHEMFHGDTLFNCDISAWDVSNVTDMYSMFGDAFSFNQDLSSWDVSKVTKHSYFGPPDSDWKEEHWPQFN